MLIKNDFWIKRIIAVLLAIVVVYISLVSAAQLLLTVFNTPWFSHEYDKYSVLEDVRGNMTEQDALWVSADTVEYLCGYKKTLDTKVHMDGREVSFFSDREKAHLKDCRKLVRKFLWLRDLLVGAVGVIYAINVVQSDFEGWPVIGKLRGGFKKKEQRKQSGFKMAAEDVAAEESSASNTHDGFAARIEAEVESKVAETVHTGNTVFKYYIGTVAVIILLVAAMMVASGGFNGLFEHFHNIAFSNDYWVLNPSSDNLINLLPIGFFRDTARVSSIIALLLIAIVGALVKYLAND